MSQEPRRLTAAVAKAIRDGQDELLAAWMEEQLASETLRLDLIDTKTLELESREFLAVLVAALDVDSSFDLEAQHWRPVLALLEELSRARDQAGFSPSETAHFVLSLKRPLVARLVETLGLSSLSDDLWHLKGVLDRLALHSTEVYQQRRESMISRQQEEMEELSTPVVKIWDGILALPLIGTLDTRRSQMVTESLLEMIASTGSDVAILDLTGVPAIDTRMAQHLMRTVAAARLMGAECILSGIRPQIAQTIVHLKIDLGNIKTEATLAAALRSALREAGWKVAKQE